MGGLAVAAGGGVDGELWVRRERICGPHQPCWLREQQGRNTWWAAEARERAAPCCAVPRCASLLCWAHGCSPRDSPFVGLRTMRACFTRP